MWSEHQECIFNFVENTKESLVVVARAGSGKTTTIKELCRRIKNRKVLVCAFNNKIRDELIERLKDLRHVQVKGMNQIGYGTMIRHRGAKLDVDRYRIRDYIRRIVPNHFKDARGDVIKLVTMCMANLSTTPFSIQNTMADYNLEPTDPKMEQLYVAWVIQTLEFSEVPATTLSFDEQIYLPAKLDLKTGSYDDVIVDEAQDLNACQYKIALNAVNKGGRVIAVGDDRQAIYQFRGAGHESLDKFRKELNAASLPLSITYRCPRKVVDLAQRIVKDFEAAPDAHEGVVLKVSEKEFLESVEEGDAVISRTNAALTKYCLMLLGKGQRARIIGRDLSSKLESMLMKVTTDNVKEALLELKVYVDDESERLLAASKDDKAEELFDNLEALRAMSEDTKTIQGLRNKISLIFEDNVTDGAGTIPFMTVHKAKGLEFNRVWMFETTFRLNSLEGENLYYVAVTRAMKELYLVQIPRSDGKKVESLATTKLEYKDC